MEQPIALSFDLVNKDKESISAADALSIKRDNSNKSLKSQNSVLQKSKSLRSVMGESSDNVELDSEGNLDNIDVVKK